MGTRDEMEPGDGDFDEVGRELRERVGGEFRLAAEEDEYWAMKQARRAGTLQEIAYDAMSRGDLVEVWAGGVVFRGHVRYARNDLLVLAGPADVDVNLDAPFILRTIRRSATSGVTPDTQGPGSFAARMAELEQSQEVCEFVGASTRATIVGRVGVRARDHVVVQGEADQEWVVPLRSLIAVVNRSTNRRNR